MQVTEFREHEKGILYKMLLNAYSEAEYIVTKHREGWEQFDAFVFDNLSFMNGNGFISMEDGVPVGFFSWDSRKLPDSIEIGHNCIITEAKGAGKGKEQLATGLSLIKLQSPGEIVVKTGNTPFFLPARRMYESAGFLKRSIIRQHDADVLEVIEYVLGSEKK